MKPKILITGGSGFVGSAFSRLFHNEYDIFAIGRHIPVKIPVDNFFQIDLAEPDAETKLSGYLKDHHFLTAIHFAANTPHSGNNDQSDYYRVNTIGTLHFLHGVRSFVEKVTYISTVDVFGIAAEPVINELSLPKPENNYAISKYAAEMLTQAWSKETKTPASIIRLGQIYGPGDPSKKAIANFCRSVLENKPVILRGTGQDIRQPIFIEDVLYGINSWIQHKTMNEQFPYLFVGMEKVTIQSLALTISKLDPRKNIEIVNSPATKPLTFQQFDNMKTRNLLDWEPKTLLVDGLMKTFKSMTN